jgi:hypothetical protein
MSLFKSHFSRLHDKQTSLPFSIGGVTQNGKHNPAHNNQDAMAIHIDHQTIIGVVSDGCAGTPPVSENDYSFNEMGAQLSCLFTVKAIRDVLSRNLEFGVEFVENVYESLLNSFINLSRMTGGDDIYDLKLTIHEFFTATCLAVVITKKKYIILSAGDGSIAINGKFHILDDQAGIYPTHDVLARLGFIEKRNEKAMRLFETGETEKLNSVILASDGVDELIGMANHELKTLEQSKPPVDGKFGYDPAFEREFRLKVANPLNSEINTDLHDDRTMLLVRRVLGGETQVMIE